MKTFKIDIEKMKNCGVSDEEISRQMQLNLSFEGLKSMMNMMDCKTFSQFCIKNNINDVLGRGMAADMIGVSWDWDMLDSRDMEILKSMHKRIDVLTSNYRLVPECN